MNDTLHMTNRDQELLQALVQKVRLFSQRQVADHWWNAELANARRRSEAARSKELLVRITVQARPLPLLESPLMSWQPGNPAPDFGQIAYRCQRRWRMRPTRPCTAWIATERCSQFFGGVARGQFQHGTQATHDIGWQPFGSA